MQNLNVNDLTLDAELDLTAKQAVAGGVNEWIYMPRTSSAQIPNIYNLYFDYSYNPVYNIAVQPTTINVGNDVEGGGAGGAAVGSNIGLNNTPVFLGDINLISGIPSPA